MGDLIIGLTEMPMPKLFREFPDGYQAVVGKRGVKLSGGQRQRVILSRALLQKASIIILDEPNSLFDCIGISFFGVRRRWTFYKIVKQFYKWYADMVKMRQ